MSNLTPERLRELMIYDPQTGIFWRRGAGVRVCNWRRCSSGTYGCRRNGYWVLSIDGRLHEAHRLAYMYMSGPIPPGMHIDHANRNGEDNRWCNLRLASRGQNAANSRLRKSNKSGFKGVSWSKSNKGWVAQIEVGDDHHYLGTHSTKEAAAAAYAAAARLHFGEFARLA